MLSQMNSDLGPGRGCLNLSGLTVKSDSWLSSVTGIDCHKVSFTQEPHGEYFQRPDANSFFTARINGSDVKTVNTMVDRGFQLIDTAVTLACDSSRWSRNTDNYEAKVIVEDASHLDLAEVVSIASSGFRFSRFHLDPNFPNAIADEVKSQWARNLVLGKRGDGCLVARRNGKVVGFLGFLCDQHGRLAIDLIAVEEATRGQGVGSALVWGLRYSAYEQGRPAIVGTQIANRISMRLYESLGFRFHSADYVLHGYAMSAETP